MGSILNGVSSIDEAGMDAEIVERHVHCRERWFSKLAVPAGGKTAEQAMVPFIATSGSDTWGAYIQILDVNDTPSIPGYKFFDFRHIFVVDVNDVAIYRVRFLYGSTTVEDALAALQYTDFVYRADSTSTDRKPIEMAMPRLPVGTKLWATTWCAGVNSKTISFLVGGHGYYQ
jgi:hypothetical protein